MSSPTRSCWRGLASLMFLLSGATGLAYEVIWFKRFAHVWGCSTTATASVVGSFLLGLGLGAAVLGKRADKSRVPLFWYGLCEVGIGVLALLIPVAIHGLQGVAQSVYPALEQHETVHFLLRFVLTFCVIGPPCFLMGATLPLLTKQFTPPDGELKEETGWLYGVNTAGAALGCYITGFHLLPLLGLHGTNLAAASMNLVIGIVALLVSKPLARTLLTASSPIDSTANIATTWTTSPHAIPATFLYAAVAFTGCAALMLQMVWTRQLALVLGGSTYAFTAVVFVVLVGIGLGSLIFHGWMKHIVDRPSTPVFVMIGLIATTVLGVVVLPQVTAAVGLLGPVRASAAFNAAVCVGASAVLEFLPAVAMGILFPLSVHYTQQRAADAGRAIGSIYAWNTFGTLIGSIFTLAILVPLVGISGAIRMALVLYTAALVLMIPPQHKSTNWWRLGSAFAGLLLIIWAAQPVDPRLTNAGMYVTGYRAPEQLLKNKVLMYQEGPTCNVLVIEMESGDRALRVNGKTDASTALDMPTQLGLAYFPQLLHPTAKEVMIVGFGSGTTAGATLAFPQTHVVCCEIEPAVVRASQFFEKVNHSPQKSPRFTPVYEDGRNYLQGTDHKFDLIISEPSNPWLAGVSALFTREFYTVAKSKLRDDGIFTQWIQMHSFSPAEYTMIIRTMREVFPHCCLLRVAEKDSLLLAADRPIELSPTQLATIQKMVDDNSVVKHDLQQHFGTTSVATLLLKHTLLTTSDIDRILADNPCHLINTDLNLRLEFDAPLWLFQRSETMPIMNRFLLGHFNPDSVMQQFALWQCGPDQAESLRHLVTILAQHGHRLAALKLTRQALTVLPNDPYLLAERVLLTPTSDKVAFQTAVDELVQHAPAYAHRAGAALGLANRHNTAVTVLETLAKVQPNSASTWASLATSYTALRRHEFADKAYRTALDLDPVNNTVRAAYDQWRASSPKQNVPKPVVVSEIK